MVSTATII